MKVEMVFTGLCSFLNVDGKNKTMGEPSVILVQTPHEDDEKHHHADPNVPGKDPAKDRPAPGDAAIPDEPVRPHEPHIAFLAIETAKVAVDDPSGFKTVPMALEFQYLEIDGFELSIENERPGVPNVDDSYYDHVVRKDDYWPGARNQWNPDYVAPAGGRPNRRGVKSFLRFSEGARIDARLISDVKWRFKDATSGAVVEQNFAEEVVYSGFPHSNDEIVIRLIPLPAAPPEKTLSTASSDTARAHDEHAPAAVAPSRVLRFKQTSADAGEPLTLIIGNGTESDMPPTVRRVKTTVPGPVNDHFKFLNRVADKRFGDGPLPKPVPRPHPPLPGAPTGGRPSGICGPGTGNGGTKPTPPPTGVI